MFKYSIVICCLYGLLLANVAGAQNRKKWDCDRSAPGENICRHYTGTIGDRKVSLDLKYGFCGSSNYGGSYFYYTDTRETRYIMIGEPENTKHDATLFAEDYALGENWVKIRSTAGEKRVPMWEFVIGEGVITGEWHSGDGKINKPIQLKETTNSVLFDLVRTSEVFKNAGTNNPNAKCENAYVGVVTTAAHDNSEKEFINQEICNMVAPSYSGTAGIKAMPAYLNKTNFAKYMGDAVKPENAGKTPDNATFMTFLLPVYRSNGMLVVDHYDYEYAFNITRRHTYKCIDYDEKKVWKLDDVLLGERNEVKELLRREYELQVTNQELKQALPIANIQPDDNFMILPGGLAFSYHVNDNRNFLDEVILFIPYSKLKGSLRPAFSSRMKL